MCQTQYTIRTNPPADWARRRRRGWRSPSGYYALVSGVGAQEGLGHRVGAKRRPGAQERGNSDPMRKPIRRARGSYRIVQSVPAPPGTDMVAPPEFLRNAEGAQREGHAPRGWG